MKYFVKENALSLSAAAVVLSGIASMMVKWGPGYVVYGLRALAIPSAIIACGLLVFALMIGTNKFLKARFAASVLWVFTFVVLAMSLGAEAFVYTALIGCC